MAMNFEFGETTNSRAFLQKYPDFLSTFYLFMDTARKCFGRAAPFRNMLDEISFNLGKTCLEDFLEIAFVCVHGIGTAPSKLIRGLYERTVALAYMFKHPEKAERFVRFSAIQEHRALEASLRLIDEAEFNRSAPTGNSAAEIRERYQKIKGEFQITNCKRCKTTRTQTSWDMDVPAMVHDLGSPYDALFLVAYTNANFSIHATLASALQNENEAAAATTRQKDSKLMLIIAMQLMVQVLELQHRVFGLDIVGDLAQCTSAFSSLWEADFRADDAGMRA
jgi:hypothetical protein